MPFFDSADFTGAVIGSIDEGIPEGVLVHVTLQALDDDQRWGDMHADIFIQSPTDIVGVHRKHVASGLYSHFTPLTWNGELNVPENSEIVALYRGQQIGVQRLSYERLAPGNIKQRGQYERAVRE